MWATVFFIAWLLESLLLIVFWRAGAIDQVKATAAINNSMSKLASLFKRKDQQP